MVTGRERKAIGEGRLEAVGQIDRALFRLPLILGVLGELGDAAVPFPGDDDLRHSCERALTSIMASLARIEPVKPGVPSEAGGELMAMLHGSEAARLIHADVLERMDQFATRVLGNC